MEGLTFSETVMHKLGSIEEKLDGLATSVNSHIKTTDERFKPLEAQAKKFGWWVGGGR